MPAPETVEPANTPSAPADKPWLSLTPLRDDERVPWWATGHRENKAGFLPREAQSNRDIQALIILQDCNIGGQYYRYFWWVRDDETRVRYCQVTSTWMLSTAEGVDEIPIGSTETVTLCGQYKFRLSSVHCGEFFKVFERLYE